MQLGSAIGRVESDEPSLHNWTVADPHFFSDGGHGGRGASGLAFFPLPGAAAGGFDSFLANLWVNGAAAGTQFVEIGSYKNGTFMNARPQPIEYSQVVVFGTRQCESYGFLCESVPKSLFLDSVSVVVLNFEASQSS